MKKKVVIVIPAYNEEEIIEKNIIRLNSFLTKNLRNYDWKIVISDNASGDKTGAIADRLARKYSRVKVRHLDTRPMSLSIKRNWLAEKADIYMHMDADLSTDIKSIPDLAQGIDEGYDIVIGSRNTKQSVKARSIIREVISGSLLKITQLMFSLNVSDFQCGFKAVNREIVKRIIPKMNAVGVGFMSTEMLVVAHNKGYKIKEIPITWKDFRKSKSPIFKGILDAFSNLIRIRIDLIRGKY